MEKNDEYVYSLKSKANESRDYLDLMLYLDRQTGKQSSALYFRSNKYLENKNYNIHKSEAQEIK